MIGDLSLWKPFLKACSNIVAVCLLNSLPQITSGKNNFLFEYWSTGNKGRYH